jgi:molybdopterin-guanine dinucleotide biosynthesis protein A
VHAGVHVVREEPPGGGPVAGIAAGFTAPTTGYGAQHNPSGTTVERGPGAEHGTEARSPRPAQSTLERVVLLAGDLPFVTRAGVEALLAALDADPDADTALAADADGQVNWLCAAWGAVGLRDRIAALAVPAGTSMRRINAGARVVQVRDEGGWSVDVDTPADLEAARARADQPR